MENERQAKLRKMANTIAKMTEAERRALAARSIVTTIEGHVLSMHNQCMVACQCPTATLVGGFQQWIKAGRCVRKGEHGLGIWIPRTFKRRDDAKAAGDPAAETNEGVRFLFGTVFDVSQTDLLAVGNVAAS